MTDQRGFTLVEVLVAATILSVGALGTMKALDSSARVSHSTQRTQQALAYAQQRIEEISARDWDDLGLTAVPVPAGTPDPGSPESLIAAGGNLLVPADPHHPSGPSATGVAATGEPLVVTGAGGVDPAPQPVTIGKTTARLYRYVSRVDRCATVDGVSRCATEDTLRRITVAVVLDDSARDAGRAPVWASTVVANPDPDPLDL